MCGDIIKIRRMWISDNVLIEWKKKERIVVFEHNSAILEYIDEIKSNFSGSIQESSKGQLIFFAPDDIKQFISIYYNRISYPIPVDTLCTELNDLILQMRHETIAKFKELESLWNVHIRKKDYLDKENALDGYAHDEDIYILIDIYDLSQHISPNPLTFLTMDNGICNNRSILLKILKIYDIRDLKKESAL
jgi:hypothetical protein